MLVETAWWIENRVVYLQFSGQISPFDVEQALQQHWFFLEHGRASIHTLVDVSAVYSVDPLLVNLLAHNQHPAAGQLVFIGAVDNPVYAALAGFNTLWCRDLSEAHYLLLEQDQTLPRPRHQRVHDPG